MMGFVGIVLAAAIILLYKKLVIDQYQKVLDDFGMLVPQLLECLAW